MSQGFVSRDAELSRLTKFLQKALAGETQVCFITGEAGAGKTTLIEEFAQRSASLNPNLIFTKGTCNAQTGISDPYLPFRAILRMLTGDRANTITQSNSNRLDTVFKTSGRALVEVAPELVGTLIPGGSILVALARLAAKEKGLLKGLEERAKASEQSQPDIEQSQIFLQYTALLRELSQAYPLVIILDDLQWVDDASNALLFHLVRELKDCRIFFIGLYRPNDVAVGRNGDRHPLEQTLNETKRMYGDIWIDLDQATQECGRAFVDALVDSQPNRLSQTFRDQLYQRTNGHALFTTELLRAMQERGDLVRGSDGNWHESTQLDWETLPARIEGIIEERIERLDDELRDILDAACVQGQDFIAEVVAAIQDIKKRVLIKKLSELEQRHRLVEDVDEIRVGKTKLWNYAFSHALFQVYLYNNLEAPERQLYHAEVAEILEELYADQTETIAVQLAYHYTEAGEQEKAFNYLRILGEQAYKISDFSAARNFFSQALEIAEADDIEINTVRQAQLLWWLGKIQHHTGKYVNAGNYYCQSLEIAELTDNQEIKIKALIGIAQSFRRQYRYDEGITFAQKALSLAQKTEIRDQECHALRTLGTIYGEMDLHEEKRLNLYERSLRIAVEINDPSQTRACLNNMGNLYAIRGDIPKAIKYHNEVLVNARKNNIKTGVDSLTRESITLGNIALNYTRIGYYKEAEELALMSRKFLIDTGATARTSGILRSLGRISILQGKLEEAIENWIESIKIANNNGRSINLVGSQNYLAVGYLKQDQIGKAWQIVEKIRPLMQKHKVRAVRAQVHSETFLEGLILLRLEKRQEAMRAFESARDQVAQLLHTKRWTYRYHRAFAQSGVALLASPDRQEEYLDQTIAFFQEAVDTCGWAGVLDEALIVFRELQKADPEQVLKPIEAYLLEKREIAWNNRPAIG